MIFAKRRHHGKWQTDLFDHFPHHAVPVRRHDMQLRAHGIIAKHAGGFFVAPLLGIKNAADTLGRGGQDSICHIQGGNGDTARR